MPELKNSHGDEGLPAAPPKPLASWYAQGLSDGLGDRLLMFDNSDAPSLELLRFHPDFAQTPGFETALREQVQRLNQFRHPAFARVRSVQRLEPDDDLALISNCTPGKRLSEVLHQARGPEFAATLIRQLAPALVQLQQQGHGITHGVLSPDRIVVSPDGRLTIVEHVVGAAIDTLNLRPAQLASIGVAVPPAAGASARSLDVATDWYQLGVVAVSVLIGRPVTAAELPQIENLLDGHGLSPFLREWLDRALQVTGTGITSGADARAALDELLQRAGRSDSRLVEAPREEEPESSPIELFPAEPASVAARTVEPARPAPIVEPMQVVPDAVFEPEPVQSVPVPPAPVPPAPVLPAKDTSLAAVESVQVEYTSVEPVGPLDDEWLDNEPVDDEPLDVEPAPRPALSARPSVQVRAWEENREPRPPRPPVPRVIQEPFAAYQRHLDSERPAHIPHPAPATVVVRARVSTGLMAALALIAVAEAGVIVMLSRALWRAPQPAIASETAPSGGEVLLSSRTAALAPLRLTVAPDLSWVRVVSASPVAHSGKAALATGGILRISSPIELKVFEQSRLLGSVPGADLKIPAGRHEVDLVNAALGYRMRQTLEVEVGQMVALQIAPPPGLVTVDASPWAEVSLNGHSIGRTPLGPLPLTPGEHQLSFRHPAGLSDDQRVTVKSDAKLRVVGVLRR